MAATRSLRIFDHRFREIFAHAGSVASSFLRMAARSSWMAAGGWSTQLGEAG